MFIKRLLKQDNSRPAVAKVSHLLNSKSHKQKKYISLMVVPSYSTGKTRTLRVPRALFHGVFCVMLVISAVVLGLYLRAGYHERMAQMLDASLYETEARYYEFRSYAEQVQDDLREAAVQAGEALSETEIRARDELNEQARYHQTELEIIFDKIEEIENIIRELDADRQNFIDGLSQRGEIIPPVANLVEQLMASEQFLRNLSQIHTPPVSNVVGITFMAHSSVHDEPTNDTVHLHLQLLLDELYVQRLLMENLEVYRLRMASYLRNFPTLWPVIGNISSGFGWRSDPFGGASQFHRGVDIPARTGSNIYATGGGIVIKSGWSSGYGQTVKIDHGGGIVTMYAHNSRNLVVEGQYVARGDVIAFVGSTGRSTAPHVHYEVQVDGVSVNPLQFMHENSHGNF